MKEWQEIQALTHKGPASSLCAGGVHSFQVCSLVCHYCPTASSSTLVTEVSRVHSCYYHPDKILFNSLVTSAVHTGAAFAQISVPSADFDANDCIGHRSFNANAKFGHRLSNDNANLHNDQDTGLHRYQHDVANAVVGNDCLHNEHQHERFK